MYNIFVFNYLICNKTNINVGRNKMEVEFL